MDLATFKIRYPEFQQTDDGLVETVLAEAAGELDATVWGAKHELGTGLLAAHKLSCSPHGKEARLAKDTHETVYWREFVRVRRSVVLTTFAAT
jgi:hypothetical protein